MLTLAAQLRNEITRERGFKEFYNFLFEFAKGDNPHKKVIELDFAIALWEMTIRDKFLLWDKWVKFLRVCGLLAIPVLSWFI